MNKHFLSQNSEEIIEKLRQHYKTEGKPLSKSQVYKRLDKARVKAHKENGQCWLDEKQFKFLEELDKHIKSGGSMDSFGAMILKQDEAIEKSTPATETQEEKPLIPEEILLLTRKAQEKAAGILIAENLIATDYLKNWQLLDEDLREQVKEAKSSYFPETIPPKKLAESAREQVRKNREA